MKFIVISGGVLSGLGKGVTSASIGLLLKSRGIKVTAMKCDMYLNIDAGTMNPIEHGEVFVTDDGVETDQDLGHYERFLGINLTKENYTTNGQIYKLVLDKERSLDYGGKCVEPYHHLPPEIIKKWYAAGEKHNADVVLVELGGTVGEYEGLLFFESIRRLKLTNPKDIILVHVGYLPAPPSIGELKSKPLQQSVGQLNSLGLMPDFIVCRSEKAVDEKRKGKIALASGLLIENIVSNPDVDSIYEVPLILEKQGLATKIIKKLKLKHSKKDLSAWIALNKSIKSAKKEVKIGIVGKYQKTGDYVLTDSYVCVVESLKHAGWKLGIKPKLIWIDSEEKDVDYSNLDGIIVPQGWGKRGVEGKINAVKFARENNIPYLGLCFGMQMAVIEFARNVLNFKNANTTEADPNTKYPVIHTMDYQKELIKNKQYGGTIRLGSWPCKIKKGTKLSNIYKKDLVNERHRHRYEFNNIYKDKFEKKGLTISGTSPDGKLVEAVEITNHRFFVGTQFHPEYISRPLTPHPIFVEFLKSTQR
ncbi:CTP synthase [Candidatus Woesebacteria bacterium RIFOXYC1_FULL_31_51]|uniref:CTP synthase n=1 Tax=Candidatus Woesebacteria bacterium GW2011_GWC2_31_9 TaxID=1618586 RepID=A0A0F9YKK8_9BACT|nr:MAG: CTP synthetase, CTP synthase [Candidatus Woesebacteria bacterium GW2011_GWF1_31_35]KKP26947.1 MAG: CTP synthetase [Candidatus Woesebacteria bacterium GW2011_GWD1_31_12]KKP27216.1 MAG: CTP synthetase [Candidatus Woesebacteria bacterium GW2011_GWB1_31_29]KKP31803.1 MAG: CTP synthetase [Candidatus Woesebacteria bacterium GW2011_GWC2_31_9]KKP33899.1 MAG: CTP synthetase [Candidatus Woesebacteria bacterium GW2011_GWE2_31_6]KKP34013.1 MAG: CTP synthetase [Candidatus Woesebacteria bacterium GW